MTSWTDVNVEPFRYDEEKRNAVATTTIRPSYDQSTTYVTTILVYSVSDGNKRRNNRLQSKHNKKAITGYIDKLYRKHLHLTRKNM